MPRITGTCIDCIQRRSSRCVAAAGADDNPPGAEPALDSVADAFIGGQRFRILTVVDDFTSDCLALVADTSLSSVRVARELYGLLASAAGR